MTAESALSPIEILKRREVVFQEYRQNCMFRFQNHVFDSTLIVTALGSEDLQIHFDVFQAPVLIEDLTAFREAANKASVSARKAYFQAFI